MALIGVLLQNFGNFFVYVNFEFNRDYIAKNLCVKKDIEDNDCKGNCHLEKQLDKAEEQEQKQLPKSNKENSETMYCHNLAAFKWQVFRFVAEKKLFLANSNRHCSSPFLTEVFQPPELT